MGEKLYKWEPQRIVKLEDVKNIYAGKKFKISDIGLLFVINLWPDNVSLSLPPLF